tara:strand:- start:4793 stop:5353 length:561 start_codon:yes stop_codon:yes gene_type:complete
MSQLIKNLVDVSEYADDGKKLFDENPTPIELKYRIVRGKHILDNADMPTQVSNSVSIYNNPRYEILYYKVKREIEKITGKRLHRTYYYERLYKQNNVLTKHVDRPACEVSVSLHLSSSIKTPWSIFFEQDVVKEYKADVGDAILYNGIDTPHWRQPLICSDKDYYHQIFFHFVDADGEYAHFAFDR